MKKILFVVLVSLMSITFLSGCYWNEEVKPNQVAVQLNSNSITRIVPSGVYSDWGFFADLLQVNIDTMTFTVEDPEVMTKDNQAVGIRLTIQAQRKSDEASIRNLVTNWSALVRDDNMVNTISATAREGMKNGVRSFTLNELLDDRNGLSQAIRTQLESDSEKYAAKIVNVTVENVAVNPDYMQILNDKALVRAETEKELQRQDLIRQKAANDILQKQSDIKVLQEELKKQQAQTAVEVEIARREGEKVAEQYAVYKNNPQAYELEKLSRIKEVLGDKTIYFLPEGTDLSMWLSNLAGVMGPQLGE